MIIYEVNLTINSEIFDDYYKWLIPHVETILTLRGFYKAEITEEKLDQPNNGRHKKLTVRYTLKHEDDLNHYFKHHAQSMRQDAINQFGNRFNATRKILLPLDELGL